MNLREDEFTHGGFVWWVESKIHDGDEWVMVARRGREVPDDLTVDLADVEGLTADDVAMNPAEIDHELWLGDLGAMDETIEQAMALTIENEGAIVRIMAHTASERDAAKGRVADGCDGVSDGVYRGSLLDGECYQIVIGRREDAGQ